VPSFVTQLNDQWQVKGLSAWAQIAPTTSTIYDEWEVDVAARITTKEATSAYRRMLLWTFSTQYSDSQLTMFRYGTIFHFRCVFESFHIHFSSMKISALGGEVGIFARYGQTSPNDCLMLLASYVLRLLNDFSFIFNKFTCSATAFMMMKRRISRWSR